MIAATSSVPLIACGAALSGGGMALAISVWESTLQRHIPSESLSRVSSYDWFGSLAFAPLGLALWGPIAAVIGVRVSLWLAFGLAVFLTLALPVPGSAGWSALQAERSTSAEGRAAG